MGCQERSGITTSPPKKVLFYLPSPQLFYTCAIFMTHPHMTFGHKLETSHQENYINSPQKNEFDGTISKEQRYVTKSNCNSPAAPRTTFDNAVGHFFKVSFSPIQVLVILLLHNKGSEGISPAQDYG